MSSTGHLKFLKFFWTALTIFAGAGLHGSVAQAQEDPIFQLEPDPNPEEESPIEMLEDDQDEDEDGDGVKDVSIEKRLIQGNIMISEWFDSTAEGLDLFLAGKKLTNRRNETSVRLSNTTVMTDGRGISNNWGLGANLRLPNLEEYWHLKFTTYDEQEERRAQSKNLVTPAAQREQNYGATVGLFRKLGNVRTSFQPRIELQDPLKVSHSLRFESVAEWKTFEVNPKLEFYATPEKGTGIFTGLNFNFVISKVQSFTIINESDYEEKSHLYSVTHGFSLGEAITDTQTLSYNIYINSNNQPNYHLEGYSFSIGWNQLLYKNMLDYAVLPHLIFQEDEGYVGRMGISLDINVHF